MKPVTNPIYQPTGRAREYGEYALNIYQGCPFSCSYCYCPNVVHIPKAQFHANYQPRLGIVEAVEKQLKTGKFAGKLIHLCFIGDPYGSDGTTPTREIIKLLKEAGCHVQVLTKGGDRARRDFDLLDSGDWFGITITTGSDLIQREFEPGAANIFERYLTLKDAYLRDINTWISFEPVLEPINEILSLMHTIGRAIPGCLFKFGKLNHVANYTDWKLFGLEAERICKENGWNYMIKADLRKEMEK